ncbi:TPA: hypothetical protein PP069_003531, partial [Serratia rubidaea]|nr:hypothetical protein [Serratia rubidaea]
MNKALGDSWKKMQSAESQHEKEQHCKEFLSLFVRATFWLEYEERADDKGKPIGLIFTTAQEDNLGHLTFVYLGEGGEEPPALLSEVIAAGNRKFFPCDGASLLGIMHGAGCTVVVIAGEEEFIYLTQDIVAAFYSILVKRNGSKKSGGTNWLLVGLFSLFCLAALWGTYYWG